MYEQLLEQLLEESKRAAASARYQRDKSVEKWSYHSGEQAGFVQAMNIVKRLTGERE